MSNLIEKSKFLLYEMRRGKVDDTRVFLLTQVAKCFDEAKEIDDACKVLYKYLEQTR